MADCDFTEGIEIARNLARRHSSSSMKISKIELEKELFAVASLALVENYDRYQALTPEHQKAALYCRLKGVVIDYL